MKKGILGVLACAGLLLLGACTNGKCGKDGSCKGGDEDQVYTGMLPAADADGIRCTLVLDYDDDMKDGDFDMLQTYVKIDSMGVTDINSFKSKGDFIVETRGADKYLKLVEKGAASSPIYFQQTDDTTLTMVNDSLQPSASGLNYSLKLVK